MSGYERAALMPDALAKAEGMRGDRGYDADWLRETPIARGITRA